MQVNPETVKSVLHFVFGCLVLVLTAWISPQILRTATTLLDRVATAQAFEVAGFKIVIDDAAVSRGFKLVGLVPGSDGRVVQTAIKDLESKQFIRLMTVAPISSSCEFETPTPGMRSAVAVDYELQAKGLTLIEDDNRAVLDEVRAARAVAEAEGKPWDIGAPLRCYKMTLARLGSDVRTVIVTSLAPAAGGLVPDPTPQRERQVAIR